MEPVNLKLFRRKVGRRKLQLRKFLSTLAKQKPRGLPARSTATDTEVWKEVHCLSCANCCKTMSPTFSKTDIRRISTFLNMKPSEFIAKWLYKDREGDWLNTQQPCQFLDVKTNYCNIYPVRPKDCAGFPHHNKKPLEDYVHVFKQNIEFCPATFTWVEKMMAKEAEIAALAKK